MKTAMLLYVLVADPGRARIYRATTPVLSLDVVYNQRNFTGRKRPSGLDLSRIGIQHKNTPDSHHAMATADEDTFVSDVCKVLQTGLQNKSYDALVLIAPGELLNSFLVHLNQQCLALLAGTINKAPGPMAEQDVIKALAHI